MLLNKTYKPWLILIGLMILALNLCAWSVSDFYLGNVTPSFSARLMAMGNTGVYDTFSPMSLIVNPANITMLDGQAGISADGLFTRNEDNRSFPLYNSFDTFIDDATYSSNINLFDDYGFAGFARRNLTEKFLLGLGLQYNPVVNFKGTYNEQVRNNRNSDNDGYPEIIAMNEINNTGRINALGITLGGGWKFNENLQLCIGGTFNSLSGNSDFAKSIKWTQWSMTQSINTPSLQRNVLPDSLYSNKADLDGTQIKLGSDFKLGQHIGLGLSYSVKSTLDRNSKIRSIYGPDTTMAVAAGVTNLVATDNSYLVKDKYILPSSVRFGFNYQPRNIMQTYFNAEIEYVVWTDVNKLFKDSWNLHVGVEHGLTNRIPLRLGFQALTEWQAYPNYNNLDSAGKPALEAVKVITPSIMAGSSVTVMKNVVLDIGLSFSWREYQALDLFRDAYYNDKIYTNLPTYLVWPNGYILPSDRGWENPDKVRESFTQISTGFTWTW